MAQGTGQQNSDEMPPQPEGYSTPDASGRSVRRRSGKVSVTIPPDLDDLVKAGKSVTKAASKAASQTVTAASKAASQAVTAASKASSGAASGIDLSGITDALATAARSFGDALAGKKSELSPYIVDDRHLGSKGSGKFFVGLMLLTVAIPLVFAGLISLGSFFDGAWLFFLLGVPLLVVGGNTLSDGRDDRRVARTLRKVSRVIGDRPAVRIDELAGVVDISSTDLTRDLKSAVAKGLIPQGHVAKLDGRQTLYLTEDAYKTHSSTVRAAKRERKLAREAAAPAPAKNAATGQDDALTPDAREAIAACEAFDAAVRECAPDLADHRMRALAQELAAKALVVSRRVRRDPSLASGVNRYASYYLPTAQRMVRTAAELDRDGAVGDNASETRAEVTSTLQMLCDASTKLLDDLLEDSTWDLSADAGVMRTMLRQDGLASDDGPTAAAPGPAASMPASGPAAAAPGPAPAGSVSAPADDPLAPTA